MAEGECSEGNHVEEEPQDVPTAWVIEDGPRCGFCQEEGGPPHPLIASASAPARGCCSARPHQENRWRPVAARAVARGEALAHTAAEQPRALWPLPQQGWFAPPRVRRVGANSRWTRTTCRCGAHHIALVATRGVEAGAEVVAEDLEPFRELAVAVLPLSA